MDIQYVGAVTSSVEIGADGQLEAVAGVLLLILGSSSSGRP
jgi:hypothetical protein